MSVLVLAIGLHPTLIRYNPWWREYKWHQFFNDANSRNYVEAAGYWELRDRVSIGSIELNMRVNQVREILEIAKVPEYPEAWLTYKSNRVMARDFLVKPARLNEIIGDLKAQSQTGPATAALENGLIFQTDQKTWTLMAWWPAATLYQVNGLFNFYQEEKELIGDRVWLTVAKISL